MNTPYPGTETWHTEARQLTSLDYRLFDIQHALLPTKLPLERFYTELVSTQGVINRKHLGWVVLPGLVRLLLGLLLRGQTNFLRSLWRFNRVYNARKQLAEHSRPARYLLTPPCHEQQPPKLTELYVHAPTRVREPVQPPAAAGLPKAG